MSRTSRGLKVALAVSIANSAMADVPVNPFRKSKQVASSTVTCAIETRLASVQETAPKLFTWPKTLMTATEVDARSCGIELVVFQDAGNPFNENPFDDAPLQEPSAKDSVPQLPPLPRALKAVPPENDIPDPPSDPTSPLPIALSPEEPQAPTSDASPDILPSPEPVMIEDPIGSSSLPDTQTQSQSVLEPAPILPASPDVVPSPSKQREVVEPETDWNPGSPSDIPLHPATGMTGTTTWGTITTESQVYSDCYTGSCCDESDCDSMEGCKSVRTSRLSLLLHDLWCKIFGG